MLTGWLPGVGLDERGRAQAAALAARLAPVPLDAIVTSPLDRCQQTTEPIAAARNGHLPSIAADPRLGECHYGDWTGRTLKELEKDPLWPVVQAHPSAVRFPGTDGESMLDMQHRAVAAVRDWNARLGKDATYLICSHGDVIKAIVADSLGLHLDLCQRIQADPCSLTVIRYTSLRPFLLRLNDVGGGVADLLPQAAAVAHAGLAADSDAVIGGGAGTGAGTSADQASADQASADPASADPASADPASADPASADPASAGPARADPAAGDEAAGFPAAPTSDGLADKRG